MWGYDTVKSNLARTGRHGLTLSSMPVDLLVHDADGSEVSRVRYDTVEQAQAIVTSGRRPIKLTPQCPTCGEWISCLWFDNREFHQHVAGCKIAP